MANIRLIRVDHRLIHGQVAINWISKCGANKIVVIDDRSAANEMMRDVLELATPPGIKLEVYSIAQAVEEWKKDQFGEHADVMVIFKTIAGAFEAKQQGFEYKDLLIGGCVNAPGRKVIEGPLTVDEAEYNMLNQLTDEGVNVTMQQTIATKLYNWPNVAKKIKF